MELIDIGINLSHSSFAPDRNSVIQRARAANVTAMIVTGTSVKSSQAALALVRSHPGYLYATAGIHPHDARSFNKAAEDTLRKLSREPGVVAIGECGLDFNRDFSPRPSQERCFEAQLALAAERDLPLFLHERDAHARFLEILTPHRKSISGGVVHCFTGTERELEAYLALDLYIGITGWICDERRGRHLQDLVKKIPSDRLLIETDAPYLLPRDLPQKPKTRRNEPAFLPHILKTIAACRGETPEEVAATTTRNARVLFGLPRPLPAEGDTRFA